MTCRRPSDAEVTIFASGSEVEIALDAKAALEEKGHPTRVVSVPCVELFEEQTDEYKAAIIGDSPVRIAIEAAIRQGWDRFIGDRRHFHRHAWLSAHPAPTRKSTGISTSPPRRPSRPPRHGFTPSA